LTASHGLVLGGYATTTASIYGFTVYKLLQNGALDLTFTSTGSNTYAIGTSTDSKASSMVVDANGNILLGGCFLNGSKNYFWSTARVLALGGALDGSYGNNGIQNFIIPTSNAAGVIGISNAANGAYLLTGTADYAAPGNNDILVKKINADGSLNLSYGNKSEVRLWIENAISTTNDMVIRADGEMWVAGNYTDPNNISFSLPAVALFKTDGSIDASITGTAGADPGVIVLTTLIPALAQFPVQISAIELQPDGKILLSGNYFDNSFLFIARLNKDGSLDNTFNSAGTPGYNILTSSNNIQYVRIYDLLVQKADQKILVYGYAANGINLIRFNTDGTVDGNFATKGIYTHPNTSYGNFSANRIEIKQQSSGNIIGVGTSFVNSSADFLVFRLIPAGSLDPNFGTNGVVTYAFSTPDTADYASSVVIKSDDRIIVGGYTSNIANGDSLYALLQLTKDGKPDGSFGNGVKVGAVVLNRGYSGQNIVDLKLESDNAIVALGQAGDKSGNAYITSLRFTGAGTADPTYVGNGNVQVVLPGKAGYAKLYNGGLFINGSTTDQLLGIVAKVTLGTGPVIKKARIQLANLQKTYGDAPFLLKPITNSPAPVYYTITQPGYPSGQILLDGNTGLVTVMQASSDGDVQVTAIQPAVAGFTGDTTSFFIHINSATPVITFNDQGGLVGSKFALAVRANTPGTFYFSQSGSTQYLSFYSTDSMQVLGEGSTTMTVTFSPASSNYVYGTTATATVSGYLTIMPPDAFDDQAVLTQGVDTQASINVLANDVSYTGQIVPSLTDLDPNTPGLQTSFVSPALGSFYVDSLGNVIYTPFQGFVGSGSITYTITDTRGQVSAPASIMVTVNVPGAKPALKATELFTPNNDGLNEAFVIGYVDLTKENQLKIFDRNGEMLYSQSNYKNDWTGTLSDGKQADNGFYYFLFTEGSAGDQRELKGVVELKR
jgi:gliding motility-associated-like protein/uncharacterized delta-60 repeat protein